MIHWSIIFKACVAEVSDICTKSHADFFWYDNAICFLKWFVWMHIFISITNPEERDMSIKNTCLYYSPYNCPSYHHSIPNVGRFRLYKVQSMFLFQQQWWLHPRKQYGILVAHIGRTASWNTEQGFWETRGAVCRTFLERWKDFSSIWQWHT